MNKAVEFSHIISPLLKDGGDSSRDPEALVREARFFGIASWAKRNNIPVTGIEDLNRICMLRTDRAISDPSLIPIPEGTSAESFETAALFRLAPGNVRDSISLDIKRRGPNDPLVRRKLIQHFVNADFVRRGLPEVDQSTTKKSVKEVIETGIANKKSQVSEKINLGELTTRRDIPSTLGPFEFAPNCEIRFTPEVVNAIGKLVEEHARVFSRFVPENTEGDEQAYQHCIKMADGSTTEPFFQVDIAGLSERLIKGASATGAEETTKALRNRIFEFEPSIAMYGLIGTLGGKGSLGVKFREHLNIIRARHKMPIVLLAPTREKHKAIREEEFGKVGSQVITDEEVNQISGFDALWGPDEFLKHLEQNGGQCKCLLYVRPSDPISKLKDPKSRIESPLLENPNTRRIIRKTAITLNIDSPNWPTSDLRRIKDSKAALPLMDMGFRVDSVNDVVTDDGSGQIVTTATFSEFMSAHGLSQLSPFRAKPLQGVFGGYGQKTINFFDRTNIEWLKEMLDLRGSYIIQPEIEPLVVTDNNTNSTFAVMERAFFSLVKGRPEFMGGIRILIPLDSDEAQRGRLHGTREMISAPIMLL